MTARGRQALALSTVQIHDKRQRNGRTYRRGKDTYPPRLNCAANRNWGIGDDCLTPTRQKCAVIGDKLRAERHKLKNQRRFSTARATEDQQTAARDRDGAAMQKRTFPGPPCRLSSC